MERSVVDRVAEDVLQRVAGRESVSPAAMTVLLRAYAQTGREDVRDGLGQALAEGLERAAAPSEHAHRAEWLVLFAETLSLSDDDRVRDACTSIACDLQAEWPSELELDRTMRSIEACLSYGIVQPAIDELERVAGRTYSPGCGFAHSPRQLRGERGTFADHVSTASALLAALGSSGRVPYGMLAEETMQFARRSWWGPDGGFAGQPFAQRCAAARVLGRLAALQQDEGYRQAAIALAVDYAADLELLLERLAAECDDRSEDAAHFALAVLECVG